MRLELRQWLKFTLATIGHHKAVALSYSAKKSALKIFTKLTGKNLCRRFQRRCFPVNFSKSLKTHFYKTHHEAASVYPQIKTSNFTIKMKLTV